MRFEAELDLRMNQRKDLTAAKVVNTYSVAKLREIFFRYGDLKNAGRISSLIETARSQSEIKTTGQLKDILKSLAPRMQENKFYAKVFQALRIEVNDEMGALEEMLEQTADLLKPGGRLVVISYHSLEDRLVKNLMKTGNVEGKVHKDFFGNVETPFEVITRKPIIPTDKEIEANNRARSAKLRIAEKINGKG